jgi:hypothetical protein
MYLNALPAPAITVGRDVDGRRADAIHSAMHDVQPAGPHSDVDRRSRQTELAELRPGDQAELAQGEPVDSIVGRGEPVGSAVGQQWSRPGAIRKVRTRVDRGL